MQKTMETKHVRSSFANTPPNLIKHKTLNKFAARGPKLKKDTRTRLMAICEKKANP